MKKTRIGAFLAAGVLTLAFAGTALADGTVNWTGNGSDAAPCTGDHEGQTHWIFSPGGGDSVTAAELTVDGVDQGAMDQNGGGSWSLFVDGTDLPGSASVDFTGDLGNGKAVLTISCRGETTTTTTSSESTTTSSEETTTTSDETTTTSDETTTTSSDETSSTSTTETGSVSDTTSTSESTSHTGTVEAETGTPDLTPPPTDAISSTSGPSSGSWQLFLLGAAGILAGILLVGPATARSRNKR